MEGPTLELAVQHFADDRDAIGPVQSNSCEVEDGRDCGVRSQTDQIDEHTSGGKKPYCVDWSIGLFVDFIPNSRQGQHFVARIRPDRSGAGLNGCHGGEIENKASSHGEEDASFSSDHVVEDLRDGLVDHVAEGVGWVTATISEHDGEKPASYPGEAEREGNGPRCFDLRILDFLGNVSSRVVVSHGP